MFICFPCRWNNSKCAHHSDYGSPEMAAGEKIRFKENTWEWAWCFEYGLTIPGWCLSCRYRQCLTFEMVSTIFTDFLNQLLIAEFSVLGKVGGFLWAIYTSVSCMCSWASVCSFCCCQALIGCGLILLGIIALLFWIFFFGGRGGVL